MKEIFKDVPNYEGIYQVSNLGKVKSLSRTIIRSNGYKITIKEKILKAYISTNNYLLVKLYKDKKCKTFQVHQLVAMAFLNHKPDGYKLVVDHIDNNSLNNNVDNLQIVTNRYNASKDRKGYSSKYVGVYFFKSRKKWVSQIQINGTTKHLGIFHNEYDAYLAYQKALETIKN